MNGTGEQLVEERVPNFNPQTRRLTEERGGGSPLLHVSLPQLFEAPHFPTSSAYLLLLFFKASKSDLTSSHKTSMLGITANLIRFVNNF